MNTQVNVRLPSSLLSKATSYAQKHGFGTLQELIKATLRERIDPQLTQDERWLIRTLLTKAQEKRRRAGEEELFRTLRRSARGVHS
jgi:Arc/MetJ-type ribon-helix-helix transcriptional regulator